ncbi:MAG: hypothetical protein AMDU1_APLC00001G0048 [Thermoplasmatales archaeon A-plasma]|nr:MAG: hypothetical protein AMDU1_APLC00001G0048 [Thermoplasmatales archaeon A-plasma]WMT44919.1 MAG: agmatinase [Cuniculiplasma divulgatum]
MGDNGRQEDNVPELKDLFSHRKIADAVSPYTEARYVVFGVPFDGTSSFRRGSRLAPDTIRLAYDNLESFEFSYGVDFLSAGICDMGNLQVGEDVSEVVDTVESVTGTMMRSGKVPVMLGGEHSVTVGAVRNIPKDTVMIIIDAHSDFRDEYMGNRLNHACVTRRALEILGAGKIFSIGTRSVSMEEYRSEEWSKVRFFTANEVRTKGIMSVIQEIESRNPARIYFSIDMDGIDPSEAPGVGTPEPYGISAVEVRSLITHFAKRIIGFDVVEMTPVYDNGNTSMLAAKLIQDFIGSRESMQSLF